MRYFTLVALAARMVWRHMISTRRRFVFYCLLDTTHLVTP